MGLPGRGSGSRGAQPRAALHAGGLQRRGGFLPGASGGLRRGLPRQHRRRATPRPPRALTTSPGSGAPLRWLAGDREICAAIARAWPGPGGPDGLLRDRPGRRRLLRLRLADGTDVFVKHYAAGATRRRRRALARALRVDAARREWRNLRRLARAGVDVPAPLALGALPGGERVLATAYLKGIPLAEALVRPEPRSGIVRAVGELVAALHASGCAHRDLHPGNLLWTEDGPVLLDLQLARRARSRAARLRDLGELDQSLEGRLPLSQRVRLRARALGLERPFDARARRQLRAVARAARRRARARALSRARRSLRPGRRFAAFRWRDRRGLAARDVDPAALRRALEAADLEGRAKLGGLSVRVCELGGEGPLSRLRTALSGSRARRAWWGAWALVAHRVATPTPIAFLESRAGSSLLVVEAVDDAHPVADAAARAPRATSAAIAHLWLRLDARGIALPHLDVSRLRVALHGPTAEALVAEAGRVRLPRRRSAARRRRELERLGDSLARAAPEAPHRDALATCRLASGAAPRRGASPPA